jgi:hypothetical protein
MLAESIVFGLFRFAEKTCSHKAMLHKEAEPVLK